MTPVFRFAPSPNGLLHLGHALSALTGFELARRTGGRFILRIEDIDTPRNVPGAADGILTTLAAFGFEWDGPVLWQSSRLEAYAEALAQLRQAGVAYACACSRMAATSSSCWTVTS